MTGMEVAVMMALSTAVKTVGALASASAKSDTADYNASVAEYNAELAIDEARSNELEQRSLSAAERATMMAQFGASGAELGSGSPLLALADAAATTELDALQTRWAGEAKAAGYLNQSNYYELEADAEETEGYFNAASTLVSGATDVYKAS